MNGNLPKLVINACDYPIGQIDNYVISKKFLIHTDYVTFTPRHVDTLSKSGQDFTASRPSIIEMTTFLNTSIYKDALAEDITAAQLLRRTPFLYETASEGTLYLVRKFDFVSGDQQSVWVNDRFSAMLSFWPAVAKNNKSPIFLKNADSVCIGLIMPMFMTCEDSGLTVCSACGNLKTA